MVDFFPVLAHLLLFVILIINSINKFSAECPKPEYLLPCYCDSYEKNDTISCGGNENFDLKFFFEKLSQQLKREEKIFYKFYLNNTSITDLKENTFSDITFEEIFIQNALKLSSIHLNAFNSTNSITKRVYITYTPISYSLNQDIFHVLSLMENIEDIRLLSTNLTEIPSNAFKPVNGFQDKLKIVSFWNSSIHKLGDNAFSNLNSVTDLILSQNSINFIPANAFRFENQSKDSLTVDLNNNPLNGSSFELNSFLNIKRPTNLLLFSDPSVGNLTYLDERIFLPFLSLNENKINLKNQNIDCNDCRSYWLNKNHQFIERIVNLKCNNGKSFMDENNFSNCSAVMK